MPFLAVLSRLIGPILGFIKWLGTGIAAYVMGKRSARLEAAEKGLKRARKANEIDEEVGYLTGGAARKRLRKYQRD